MILGSFPNGARLLPSTSMKTKIIYMLFVRAGQWTWYDVLDEMNFLPPVMF
jgi:hypothetical protein